jgi:hypothetical protein
VPRHPIGHQRAPPGAGLGPGAWVGLPVSPAGLPILLLAPARNGASHGSSSTIPLGSDAAQSAISDAAADGDRLWDVAHSDQGSLKQLLDASS